MKVISKIIATALIIMMLLLNPMIMVFAVEGVTGTVNTETLRLRKDPSVESMVLDLLSKDDKVEILEEKDGWYKVKFKDYTGYVSKEFITKSGEVKQSENETSNEINKSDENTTKATVTIKNEEAKTNCDTKLYILPLINSNVLTNLKQNTAVKIINITGGWVYISTDEISGWIRLDKLSVSQATNNEASIAEKENSNQSNQNQSQNDDNKTNENTNQKTNTTTFNARNAYIKGTSVNVRSSSTTTSQVVATLSQNTQVKLVGEDGDWYKVEYNGKNGYVLKTLVSDKKTEVTSRSSMPTREKTTSETTNTNNENSTSQSNTNKTQTTTSNNEQATAEKSQSASSKGEEVIAYAKNYLGCKYVYAGSGPSVFDCSGFTMYVYKHFGYSMGHSAVTQAYIGTYVPRNSLKAGDLVIFNNQSNTSIGHVGIYVGNGNFIHASSGSGKVIISSLSNAYYNARYVTGRRIF